MAAAQKSADVVIVMGSDSDFPVMRQAAEALQELGLSFEMRVLSAHRTPNELIEFVQSQDRAGAQVFIAGAGAAAHLPGVVAAFTTRPVIGIPIGAGALKGQDSLLAIVQMPRGIPVATVAIDGAWNAGVLAAQMIATGDSSQSARVTEAVKKYRQNLREKVLAKKISL